MISDKELLLSLERDLRKCASKNGNVKMKDIEREISYFLAQCDIAKKEDIPVQKFLFVEDGSVDTDDLEELLYARNPEIKLIVYRQGAARPRLEDVHNE